MIEISCEGCIGACCKSSFGTSVVMDLDKGEYSRLTEAGTDFLTLVDPEPYNRYNALMPYGEIVDPDTGTSELVFDRSAPGLLLMAGYGRYILRGACGNLAEENGRAICMDYDNRPQVCRDFDVGGEECLDLRNRYGIEAEVSVQITPKPTDG